MSGGGRRYRLHGDNTLLSDGEGALHAAQAATASRNAIRELLRHGETGITANEIFARFPDHVEQAGALATLPQWHEAGLRELCFGELFGGLGTRMSRLFVSAAAPRFGVPSEDLPTLRNDGHAG